jgi:catechol-2,3-dioxygenase
MAEHANPIRIRKLGHIGLHCHDLQKMVDFYTRVLGFKVSDVNEKGLTFLRFGSDHHTLVLAKMPDGGQKKGATGNALHHIALEVENLGELKSIRKYLVAQGVPLHGKIKHEGPGMNYVLDFEDPEGNRVQFFSDMDQIGWDGKSRPKEQWNRFEVGDE